MPDLHITQPSHGPFTYPISVELWIDHLLSPIGGGPFGVFDSIHNILHDILHPIAHLIDAGVGFLWDLAGAAWGWVVNIAQDAENAVGNAWSDAVTFAGNLVDAAKAAIKTTTDTISYVLTVSIAQVTDLAHQLAAGVLSAAQTLYNQAVALANSIGSAASQLARDLVAGAESLAQAAVNGAIQLARDLVSGAEYVLNLGIAAAEQLARDLVSGAESLAQYLVNGAISLASSALDAFIRDVFNPLDGAWHDFEHGLGHDLSMMIDGLKAAWGWIEWVGQYGFDDVTNAVQTIANLELSTVGDVVGRNRDPILSWMSGRSRGSSASLSIHSGGSGGGVGVGHGI